MYQINNDKTIIELNALNLAVEILSIDEYEQNNACFRILMDDEDLINVNNIPIGFEYTILAQNIDTGVIETWVLKNAGDKLAIFPYHENPFTGKYRIFIPNIIISLNKGA